MLTNEEIEAVAQEMAEDAGHWLIARAQGDAVECRDRRQKLEQRLLEVKRLFGHDDATDVMVALHAKAARFARAFRKEAFGC